MLLHFNNLSYRSCLISTYLFCAGLEQADVAHANIDGSWKRGDGPLYSGTWQFPKGRTVQRKRIHSVSAPVLRKR